jgi:hypothetical protein
MVVVVVVVVVVVIVAVMVVVVVAVVVMMIREPGWAAASRDELPSFAIARRGGAVYNVRNPDEMLLVVRAITN